LSFISKSTISLEQNCTLNFREPQIVFEKDVVPYS
jgi:hypothetical protein